MLKRIFLVVIATLNIVHAQPAPNQSTSTSTAASPENRLGWHVYGGAALGYGMAQSGEYESIPNGPQYFANALLSFKDYRWVYDLGVGWYYSQLKGTALSGRSIDIRTHAGTIDLSPRYRLTNRWQIGPALNIAFGTDTQSGPAIGSESHTIFAGLKTAYDFSTDKYPIRLWQQVSVDVSIANRQAYFALVGIQIGLPLQQKYATVARADTRGVRVSGINKGGQQLRLALDPQKVFFNTNSSTLKPHVKDILRSIGKYLGSNEENWGDLEVTGHADRRGRYDYNLKLSNWRAKSVEQAIVAGGAPQKRIALHAYSYKKPADPRHNREGWARNRRVELVFRDVQDPEPLIELASPLMNLKPAIDK